MRRREILTIYSSGLCELFLAALGFSVLALLCLQTLALVTGGTLNADAILLFTWQTIVFMALWPGQQFWTIRRKTASGFEHSIIGIPTDDDMRVMNRRAAQRFVQQRRD